MAKRANTKKAEPESQFETPKDGDWISVSWHGHPNSWWGPLYYRKEIEDPEKGKIEGACVLTETWSEPGKLSVRFEDVEFWCVWEGETVEEYEERRKLIFAERQRKKLPVNDWFVGEDSQRGMWSKPKIGPAMKVVAFEGHFTHPKDGVMLEVHARTYSDFFQGIYFGKADRVYSSEPLIETQNLLTGEIHYDSQGRVRYGVPMIPFAEWIRFRKLDKDRKPVSEWIPGPHLEEWKIEEVERMQGRQRPHAKTYDELVTESNNYLTTLGRAALEAGPNEYNEFVDRVVAGEFETAKSVRNSNEKLYNARSAQVREKTLHDTNDVKLERLKRFLRDVPNVPFIPLFEPDGKGEFCREKYRTWLSDEISILETALGNSPVTIPATNSEPLPSLFQSPGVWTNTPEQERRLISLLEKNGFLRRDVLYYVWLKKRTDFAYLVVGLRSKAIHSEAEFFEVLQCVRFEQDGKIVEHTKTLANNFGTLCRKLNNPNEDTKPSSEIRQVMSEFLTVPQSSKNEPLSS